MRGIKFINSNKNWNDYTDIDIAISFRKNNDLDLIRKPASKLINAWNAGCPLICDDEPSMRAIRLSELDYLIAKSPNQFINVVDKLKSNPVLYAEMVSNGKKRFEDYSREATTKKWFSLVEDIHNGKVKAKSRFDFIRYVLNKNKFF
ncbi:glycosyltransferase [Xenorhabdus szentirmaii]|uniref:glycosyltransferase n=1 Tax=Xenorhabdus szentirmaii TaxID=290112 RepID=UPI0032B7F266